MSHARKACHNIDRFVTRSVFLSEPVSIPGTMDEKKHLSAEEFSAANCLIITRNAFNRVLIVSQHPVRSRDE